MPKLSVDELRKMREEAKNQIYLRDGDFKGKIIVHMGTCGIAAGARTIMTTFLDALGNKGIKDINLTTSGCAGFCSKEPMATVELTDSPPVKYGNLSPEKVQKILNEHIMEGKIVREYAIGIGSERGE